MQHEGNHLSLSTHPWEPPGVGALVRFVLHLLLEIADVYKAIANGAWKKEDLKAKVSELDRKIALSIAPPSEAEEDEQKENNSQELQQEKPHTESSLSMETHNDKHSFANGSQKISTSSSITRSNSFAPNHNSSDKLPEDKGIMSKVVFSKPKWKI
ncbi:hypothetical protein [Porphyromonas sp.]|uniref:hypothetical protein n=1 Tax=Porphyromonas sp. TaxID=1924944 RepID=UPI0025D1277C|nr:hypothetical protein [Porphyromonas sp.]